MWRYMDCSSNLLQGKLKSILCTPEAAMEPAAATAPPRVALPQPLDALQIKLQTNQTFSRLVISMAQGCQLPINSLYLP